MTSCGEALLQLLAAYDVDTVFGIPGVHTIELYRGLDATDIRHVSPRHEQGAGFMADGYARVSGKPGVCFVITGPGMTNIATAMGQALADSIPMLVISSVNRREQLGLGEGRLHELPDQRGMLAGVSRFSHTLMRPEELPQVLARAFGLFQSERPGPVHIEIPLDVLAADATHLDTQAWRLPTPPAPDPEAINELVEALRIAEAPLLLVGGGAIHAVQEIRLLAEMLQIPVVTTVNAKGILGDNHPLATGGSASCPAVREAIGQADLVIAVGTELAETDYDFYFKGPVEINGKLARIDIDPRQLSRNLPADLAITADAALAIQAVNQGLGKFARPMGNGVLRAMRVRQRVAVERDAQYAAFFNTLTSALPEAIIVGDSTQPTYHAWLYHEPRAVRRYFHSASGFGSLGYSIPAAIGASVAKPGRQVIALIGDGGAQFTLGELASAVDAGVNTIFLVWNNEGYGEIKRFMRDDGAAEIGVDIHTPDFLALAAAMGLHAERATNHQQLHRALLEASHRRGPTLLEVQQHDFANSYPVS